jgi:hypothetical protein
MKTEKGIRVKPYMPSELSLIYTVSHPTLNKWLESIKDRIGRRIGQYYSVKQVEIIFEHFGVPFDLELPDRSKFNF